jgi:hypothetical protein
LNLTILPISTAITLGVIAIIILFFLPLSSFADPQIITVESKEIDDEGEDFEQENSI